MKAKLTAKESFVLYGVSMALVFGFFLLGLQWGRSTALSVPAQQEVQRPASPVSQTETRLDFYNQVVDPQPRQEAVKPGAEELVQPPAEEPVAAEASQTEVVLESAASTTDARVAVTPPVSAEAFTIQVAAMKTEAEARRVLVRLEARGYTGILEKPASRKDKYYRVRVGTYEDREAARRAEALLKGEGFLTYIKKIQTAGSVN